jgi:ABC-type multidrug transport system ATPase subunit
MAVDPRGPAPAPAASVRGAARDFGPGVRALAGVDLDLPRGAVTALLGANGAGKTTLLRILAGLLAPTSGQVEVLGVERPASAGRRAARELRRRTGYVPQEIALDPEMTGRETLTLLAALYGVPRRERRERVAALAEAFGVAAPLDRLVGGWSGGQKRRLHLAAGMIHDPDLLLFDEPTAGLDPEGNDFLWAELARRARAGRAVAVVTHDLAAAERHADRAAILDAGRLAAAGRLSEVTGGRSLREAFRAATGREPEPPPPAAGRGTGRGRGRS